jgi:predicted alpha/beta superfamily hydrolase
MRFSTIPPCLILFAAALAVAQEATPQAQPACTPTVTGQVQTFELPGKVFNFTRTVRVFLPPGYDDAANRDRRYPVLYMLDGQNLFDACLAYDHKHEWQVDETITRLVNEGAIEPVIAVGLDNARENRATEYLAYADNIQNPGSAEPLGRRMPEFLIKEVMPVIEGKYRIAKGRENTGIAGSSYGGFAAAYIGIHAPTVFGKVLAESPVFWVGNGAILRETNGIAMAPLKVFMAYGMKEWNMPGANEAEVRMIRQVEANLKAAILSPAEVKVVIEPEALHNEEAWAKRLPDALKFLFPVKR